jgi:surface antigen
MPFVGKNSSKSPDRKPGTRPLAQPPSTVNRLRSFAEKETPPSIPVTSRSVPRITHALPTPWAPQEDPDQPVMMTGPLAQPPGAAPFMKRPPTLIRGNGKKNLLPAPPSLRRRLQMHLIVASVLVCGIIGAAVGVTPINGQDGALVKVFQPILNSIQLKGQNTIALSQQQATATSVLSKGGYDPGGVEGAPEGTGLGRFFYGQCTYWANMRYHDLTQVWVPWLGNANQWTAGAYKYGWNVSDTPHVPSIIVLQSYIQGAGYYGHVAIVEKINEDGSVYTSNWNWNGLPAYTSYVTFTRGDGVKFVWAPGK